MLELPLPVGSFKTMQFLSAVFIGVVVSPLNALFHMDKSDMGILLDGHLILELTERVELAQCARRCSDLTHCLSFNFEYTEKICQLNSITKSQANASHVLTNGSFVFFDVSTWSQLLLDNCVSKPCNGTELCVPTRSSFNCLNTDCQDAPPSLVNGVPVQPGSNSIGTIRKYVCPSGQMAMGDNQITCPGFNWSPLPSFSCEYVRSCADLYTCDASYRDGEYWLYPSPYGTTPVKIFCSTVRREFITVDPSQNYVTNGHLTNTALINFRKIGVDIQTMIVNRKDKTFASQTGMVFYLQDLGYGLVHSCESPRRGHFKIDTSTTGLILDQQLQWVLTSNTPATIDSFSRSADGEIISAYCGGSCGTCEVNGDMILHLNPNYEVGLILYDGKHNPYIIPSDTRPMFTPEQSYIDNIHVWANK